MSKQNNNQKYAHTVFFMVGLPGSGKSTLVNGILKERPELPIISTDNEIEELASQYGIGYDKAMSKRHGIKNENGEYIDFYEEGFKIVKSKLDKLIRNKKSFIWDQTNTVKSTRRSKIRRLKEAKFNIVVIHMNISSEEWLKRLNHRNETNPNKKISDKLRDMFLSEYSIPDYSEGMSTIFSVDENGKIVKLDQETLEKNINNVSIQGIVNKL